MFKNIMLACYFLNSLLVCFQNKWGRKRQKLELSLWANWKRWRQTQTMINTQTEKKRFQQIKMITDQSSGCIDQAGDSGTFDWDVWRKPSLMVQGWCQVKVCHQQLKRFSISWKVSGWPHYCSGWWWWWWCNLLKTFLQQRHLKSERWPAGSPDLHPAEKTLEMEERGPWQSWCGNCRKRELGLTDEEVMKVHS